MSIAPSIFAAKPSASFRDRVKRFSRRELFDGIDHVEHMRHHAERLGNERLATVCVDRLDAFWHEVERRDAVALGRA